MESVSNDTSVAELVCSVLPGIDDSQFRYFGCLLLKGNYIHNMYQCLFNHACPFLTHFTALLYHSLHYGTALTALMHQQYFS